MTCGQVMTSIQKYMYYQQLGNLFCRYQGDVKRLNQKNREE
jgi:hypothetical protein